MSENCDQQLSAYKFAEALPPDAPKLADLRVAAMRPSLEAVGRFNLQRARDRFLKDFPHSTTTKLIVGNKIIGFYSLMARPDHLWLAHLYIHPDYQHLGLGAKILDKIKQQAISDRMPVRLGALKQSPANQFYQSRGFKLTGSEEFDHYYEWSV